MKSTQEKNIGASLEQKRKNLDEQIIALQKQKKDIDEQIKSEQATEGEKLQKELAEYVELLNKKYPNYNISTSICSKRFDENTWKKFRELEDKIARINLFNF